MTGVAGSPAVGDGPGEDDVVASPAPGFRFGVVATCVVPVLVLGALGWSHRWIADDGFINLRIAQQLIHGNGLVFNSGERVEASTSLLWVLLLAATKLVFGFAALEWISVVLGLVLTAGGLALAELGAYRLLPRESSSGVVLPAGALVVAALPPFWDFASSGLETGLTFAWLGASFCLLATRAAGSERGDHAEAVRRTRISGWVWPALVLGAGPLVRPDLAIFTAAFLVALLVIERDGGLRRGLAVVGVCASLPVLSEIVRMAYYAVLVPNTAIAKSAAASQWDRGWHYLANLVSPYFLWVPLLIVAGLLIREVLRRSQRREWGSLAVVAASIVGSLLSSLYVVRLGGDFMHARFLLPSVFALTMPIAVVRISSWYSGVSIATGVLVGWAIVCGLSLRVTGLDQVTRAADGTLLHSYTDSYGIGDERGIAMAATKNAHPVTLSDWAGSGMAVRGRMLRRLSDADPRLLVSNGAVFYPAFKYPLRRSVAASVAAPAGAIGVVSFAAGPDVDIVDYYGLADPIGSRLPSQSAERPGHQKFMGSSWVIARFADSAAPVSSGAKLTDVAAARRALGCGQLRLLLRDVAAPLSFGQLWRNAAHSIANTRLTLDSDPTVAARKLCGMPRASGP